MEQMARLQGALSSERDKNSAMSAQLSAPPTPDPAALQAQKELADSITAQGVMQPIVVRPIGVDRYEIIAGERRWRAAQLAELDVIPAVIRDVSDEVALALALIENIQRENLNAIEEAMALKRLGEEFERVPHRDPGVHCFSPIQSGVVRPRSDRLHKLITEV